MKKTALLSFLGKPEIKARKIAEMEEHNKLDNLIQGSYLEEHKGCAVTCTMYTPDEIKGLQHVSVDEIRNRYESELGIPRDVAILEDALFERLPIEEAKKFPLRFLKAIPVGVDLSGVSRMLFAWLLADPKEGLITYVTSEVVKEILKDTAQAFIDDITEDVSRETFQKLYQRAIDARAAIDAIAAIDARAAIAAIDAIDARAARAARAAIDAIAAIDARDARDAKIRVAEKFLSLLKNCK